MKTDTIWYQEALRVIHKACTPHGILASAQDVDNYQRIFCRDAVITGIAGLLADDERTITAFRASLLHLAEAQGSIGQIPSNIGQNESHTQTVSYGGLAGRVDATTWWIIGAGIFLHNRTDSALQTALEPVVHRAFAALRAWEFNDKGLLYIPLSGNWADEYIVQGYTLYDQLLRLWAFRAAYTVWNHDAWKRDAERLADSIRINFRQHPSPEKRYHQSAYLRAIEKSSLLSIPHTEVPPSGHYWWCSFAPNGYDTRWDMAANALALLLGLGTDEENIATNDFLHLLARTQGNWLLPAFAPVIMPEDPEWRLLEENYVYRFKNHPHHFHNGGCWFVFMGWLALGLTMQGFSETAQILHTTMHTTLAAEATPYTFFEYVNPVTGISGGTPHLCFTAAGMLLADYADSLRSGVDVPAQKLAISV